MNDTVRSNKMEALGYASDRAAETGETQYVYLWVEHHKRGYYVSNDPNLVGRSKFPWELIATINQETL